MKYLSDGLDGYDTLRLGSSPSPGRMVRLAPWACRTQPILKGALACTDPPGVAAMFLDSGGFANAYQDGIRQGGAFELKQVTWAHSEAMESPNCAGRSNPA